MSEIKRIQGMVRSIDQWLNMVPSVVATGSMAQVEYTLVDAKTDIEALWLKVAALSSAAVAEREPRGWICEGCYRFSADPEEDLKRIRLGGHLSFCPERKISPLYLDPPPTSELEAENARLRDERYVAVAAMVRSHERAEVAEARLAEAMKALEPFAEIAGEAWADGSGWTNAACQNDRICDWFGPSAFHAARRVREGGKVDG